MRLLIIGSLEGYITTAGKIARSRGANVVHVDTSEEALNALRSGQGADLIMFDVRLEIQHLLKSLEKERIHIPVVACGIGTSSENAVHAIKAGAKEYIPLPPDPELIAAVLEAVSLDEKEIIYKDPAMDRVLKLAEQVAPSDASILITGESGTGKEVIARYIHSKSRRNQGNFISVNCAAIPDNLLESELFGHEKGAFTGAIARRIGKFEEATGGTLLLDEVTEMEPRLQAKLLRALQEKEIDRVGGTHPIKIDIRILATSNRNLEEAVRTGVFREDLYFRLNVVNLNLPPLRERPLDIEVLAQHFIKKYSDANHISIKPLSEEARAMILANPWYGNVRELENAIHRAILLTQGEMIGEKDIFLETRKSPPLSRPLASFEEDKNPLVGRTVADVERDLILNTLTHCLGNRTHAANILGISIRTLRNKLKQYDTAI